MPVVVITGSRDLEGAEAEQAIRRVLIGADLVIHGGATGADAIAEEWAKKLQIDSTILRAKWKRLGHGAGPSRNERLAHSAGHLRSAGEDVRCWAFPLPQSRGTWNCVDLMKKAGVPVEVVRVGGWR